MAGTSPAAPYSEALNNRPLLSLHDDVYLAPLERYIEGKQSNSLWWNPSFFGYSLEEMQDKEQQWASPFLQAYYQFVTNGGQEGIAVTFQLGHTPACLLETDNISYLDQLLTTPSLANEDIGKALIAWHEYGHCLFHARHQQGAISRLLSADDRYTMELFADAYALTQLSQWHGIDASEYLISKRDRWRSFSGELSHWTSPALAQWQVHLDAYQTPGVRVAPALEASLLNWVTEHDWVSIRNHVLPKG